MFVGELLKHYLPPKAYAAIRPVIPTLIVLIAVGVGAFATAVVNAGEVSNEVLWRSMWAGIGAVVLHTQGRSLAKHRDPADEVMAPPDDHL